MSNVKRKTYDDTFLFSLPGEKEKHHNHISDFIVRSSRIDNKRADNFRGVIEDIRRYQKSSIIYHVLMRDDVVLCINDVEMPPAFKVFIAKDSKSNGAKKVFIDVTGVIDVKDNRYICKNIQRLITYLFEAITWLLYEYEPEALLNNSNITLSATDCFVKLFDFIVGYFRFYGFSENRTKIDYLAALYFMINILGKDDDQYTHQVAAKLTGVDQSLTKSYTLYYKKEDLDNIDSFIKLITETFKFKGFTTEVFISRWMINCGIGTQFAPELFTAFCNMMIGAYVGAYIVNQKSIEKQCGSSMIKLCENLLRLGAADLDRGKIFGESNEPDVVVRSGTVLSLQETFNARQSTPVIVKFCKDDCKSVKNTKSRVKHIIQHYTESKQADKLGEKIVAFAKLAIGCMSTVKNKDEYEIGVLTAIVSNGKSYIKGNARKEYLQLVNNAIAVQRDNIDKFRDDDKALTKVLSAQLKELLECKNII